MLNSLRIRIIATLLAVSLIPLLVVGLGAWSQFGRLLKQQSVELHRSVVRGHALSIESYLQERIRVLGLIARTHGLELLRDTAALRELLEATNASYGEAFVDLGVIDEDGAHLAYVGPYALSDRNYAGEPWFQDVMTRGAAVSDVFLGFRGVPHCVIAVCRHERGRTWILRATINSAIFDSLVQTGRMGRTGDAFIVNRTGAYQTPPRQGEVLATSPVPTPAKHQGVKDVRIDVDGVRWLRVTTWLNDDRWMLVVQQEEREIQAPARQASLVGLLVILMAAAAVVAVTVLATGHLTARIDLAHAERDRLSRDLLRSARLASLGELSSGLAHEINNPLAIISAERTNIGDLVRELPQDTPGRSSILDSLLCMQRQVQRCGNITSKMLQFGRDSATRLQPTDVAARVGEVTALLRKRAQLASAELQLDIEPGLPQVLVDASELEQVLVNLVNNSLQALNGRSGRITIRAKSDADAVLLDVVDDGCGIPPEHVDRVFEPFFTTKAPGEGTGLGLAVCYGLVRGWGGAIEAASQLGHGTRITVRLPRAGHSTVADHAKGDRDHVGSQAAHPSPARR